MTAPTITALREISEEIGAVESTLEEICETGNERADQAIRLARARLGHANGNLLATIIATESANSPIPQKGSIGFFFH